MLLALYLLAERCCKSNSSWRALPNLYYPGLTKQSGTYCKNVIGVFHKLDTLLNVHTPFGTLRLPGPQKNYNFADV